MMITNQRWGPNSGTEKCVRDCDDVEKKPTIRASSRTGWILFVNMKTACGCTHVARQENLF